MLGLIVYLFIGMVALSGAIAFQDVLRIGPNPKQWDSGMEGFIARLTAIFFLWPMAIPVTIAFWVYKKRQERLKQ